MYTIWTQNLSDPKEKSNFQHLVQGAKPVLDRLKDLLKQEENGLDRSETDIKTFDQPNWEYRQAYKNGCRAMIYNLKKLVDLDQQEQPKEKVT